jgi:hypothetical protein
MIKTLRRLKYLALPAIALCVSSCGKPSTPSSYEAKSDTSPVSIVKNGVLSDIDSNIAVGKAFERHKYLTGTTWKSIQADRGRTIVEVRSLFDFAKLEPNDIHEALLVEMGKKVVPARKEFETRYEEWCEFMKGTVKGLYFTTQFQVRSDKSFDIVGIKMSFVLKNHPEHTEEPLSDELTSLCIQDVIKGRCLHAAFAIIAAALFESGKVSKAEIFFTYPQAK